MDWYLKAATIDSFNLQIYWK